MWTKIKQNKGVAVYRHSRYRDWDGKNVEAVIDLEKQLTFVNLVGEDVSEAQILLMKDTLDVMYQQKHILTHPSYFERAALEAVRLFLPLTIEERHGYLTHIN